MPNRLLYGGQQYDPEVGQYYLRARYYNPVVGRFTQEDPYRGDGLNLYAYCANNPVTYYDPSGYVCSFNAQAEENAVRENATLQADEQGGLQGSGTNGSGSDLIEIVDADAGTFRINDWSEYPDDYVPLPDKSKEWVLLEGDAYDL